MKSLLLLGISLLLVIAMQGCCATRPYPVVAEYPVCCGQYPIGSGGQYPIGSAYDFGRPGYNPGGLGGPASGIGVRPGLGAGGFGPGR